jgi:hypothetical protein
MKNFKDFNIKPKTTAFVGEKISISRLLNKEIIVHAFKVKPSTQKEGTNYLTMQIEKSGEKRIVFTGSTFLIDMIERVPDNSFPFKTIIKGDEDYYEFT